MRISTARFWGAVAWMPLMLAGPAAAQTTMAAATSGAEEVLVTGKRAAEIPQSAKADIPLIETPQAISVVSRETFKLTGATRLADALRTVAGVSESSTYGFFDAYSIRGYDAAYGSLYLDGLTSASGVGFNRELAGLEQVEIIKGPASSLFGAAPLGGIVNLVSKRPQADTFLDIGVAAGSFGLFELTLDGNAPLTTDNTVTGRLNFVYRDSDSFVDFAHTERVYVAPALAWEIDGDTELTILADYQRDRDNPWSPTTAYGTILPHPLGIELPVSFAINEPGADNAYINQQRWSIGYQFRHALSDAVEFQQSLRYTDRETQWDRWMFAAELLQPDADDDWEFGRYLGRLYYGPYDEDAQEFAVDSRVSLKFTTGDIRHTILVGLDYQHRKSDFAGNGDYDPYNYPLDLLNPDHSGPLVMINNEDAYTGRDRGHQIGLYIQDHIEIGDLTLTLGGRQDWSEYTDFVLPAQKDQAFTPRVGITYKVAPGIALYANYAESFTPQINYPLYEGGLAEPETGSNIEGGIKVADAELGLYGMVSIFELTRQNVAIEDPDYPTFYLVTGEQRSRGVEIEGGWHPDAGWVLSIAYAYIEAEVTEDTVQPIGTELMNVPRHAFNIYGAYTVQDGSLAGLGLYASLLFNSSKNGWYAEDYRLPGYTVVDIGASYAFEDFVARLHINNLFDERYFPDSCCLDRVTPGEPLNVRVSLERRF